MAALEHPQRATRRVESAIVMQSLVRRFLARALVLQAREHNICLLAVHPLYEWSRVQWLSFYSLRSSRPEKKMDRGRRT